MYLTQHFRPEFLEKYRTALSADAFSKFSKYEPKKAEHEKAIKDATNHLLRQVIPEFAKEVQKKLAKSLPIDQFLALMKVRALPFVPLLLPPSLLISNFICLTFFF